MIFERSVLREKMAVAGGILLTLLTVTSVLVLVKGLREAALGSIGLDTVAQLLAISILNYFPLLVVATATVAIVVTLSRLYQESEMVVWQTSGVGSFGLLKPVAMLVVPMFLFLLVMNSILTPWTAQKLSAYRNQSGIAELSLLKSGDFRSSDGGKRVFFIEEVTKTSPPSFKNIFVAQQGANNETTLVLAQNATLANSRDNRAFLVLNHGVQYQDNVKDGTLQSMRYGQSAFSIDEFTQLKTTDLNNTPPAQTTTAVLLTRDTAQDRAELYRRFSDAFMILPMALLAVMLAYVRPRSSRTWGVLLAIVLLVIYINLIKVGESKIGKERWSLMYAMLLIHGSVLCCAVLALWYRTQAWRMSAFNWLRRSPS